MVPLFEKWSYRLKSISQGWSVLPFRKCSSWSCKQRQDKNKIEEHSIIIFTYIYFQ